MRWISELFAWLTYDMKKDFEITTRNLERDMYGRRDTDRTTADTQLKGDGDEHDDRPTEGEAGST